MSNLQKQVNLGQRQQGASSIGLMALLAVIAIFVVGAMRIVPIYLENQTVHRVLEGIANDPRVDARSKLSIMKSINKRLFLNDIRFIKKEHVAIARRKSQTYGNHRV